MGLRQSPNFFQFLMDRILKKLTFEKVLCYLDDLCIVSDTFENHFRDLHEILQRLENSHLKLGPNKCSFAQQRCVFLGHEISKDGIRPPRARKNCLDLLVLWGKWSKFFTRPYSS